MRHWQRGVISLKPASNTAQVGDTITFEVVMRSTDPFSAYQVKVNFADASSASNPSLQLVSDPNFKLLDVWTIANKVPYGPVNTTNTVLDSNNSILLQSALVGSNSGVSFVNDMPIGSLTVKAKSPGTLNASITTASSFTNGLEAPEGTKLEIGSPASVVISSVPDGKKGDASGDGVLSIADALMIRQFLAGIRPDLPKPDLADISGNGQVDIADALYIQQVLAGIRPDPNIAGKSKFVVKTAFNPNNYVPRPFQIPEMTVAYLVSGGPFKVGDTFEARVIANVSSNNIGAYDFTLTYDDTAVTAKSVKAGAATTDGFLGAPISNIKQSGTVKINGTSTLADLGKTNG